MWIFTPQGYLSIVADLEAPEAGRLLVRARRRKHLRNLLPDCEPFQKRPSDYPWRVWATRQQVSELVTQQLANMTYDNFKNAIPDAEYHDACLDVWEAMWRYQQGEAREIKR